MKKSILVTYYILFGLITTTIAQKDGLSPHHKSEVEQIIEAKLVSSTIELKEEYRYQLDKLEKERQLFIDDFRDERNLLIAVIGAILAILGLVFTFFQRKFIQIETGKLEQKFSTVEEKVYQRLSRIANLDKEHFIKALEQKAVEAEIINTFTIYITHNQNLHEAKEMYSILDKFGFNAELIDIINLPALSNNGVVIFFDHTKSESGRPEETKWFDDTTVLPVINRLHKLDCLLYYNEGNLRHNLNSRFKCIGQANSFATVYNNLMSLLHYKRYLNNQKSN